MKFSYKNLNEIKGFENLSFEYLLCQIEEQDYVQSINFAKEKSKFTMNLNQNGENRNQETKFNNQLQGILAEKAIQDFVNQEIKNDLTILNFCQQNNLSIPQVIRYDEVRTDGFKFAKGEFDLKLILPHKELFIESRSSKFYNLSSIDKIQEQPIIGKYSNFAKRSEKDNDYFIKTLFPIRNKEKSLLENLKIKNSFIIIGGCNLNQMKEYGYIGNLGQNQTKYNLLNIKEDNKIRNFIENLKSNLIQELNIYLNKKLEKELEINKTRNLKIKI